MGAHRRTVATVLLLLLVGLSGCLGSGGEEETPRYGVVVKEPPPTPVFAPQSPAGDPAESPEPSPSPETEEPPNRPPSVSFEAHRTRGTGPLTVHFRFDAEDPERDALSWTFDADRDGKREAHGSSLPANVTHTYPIGTWEAILKVADGNNTTIKRMTIEAVPPAPTGPPDPIRIQGTITGVLVPEVGFVPGSQNHSFALPRPVDKMTLSFTTSLAAADLDYELYAPDGRRVHQQAHYNEPTAMLPPPFIGTDEPDMVITGPDTARTGTWIVKVMPALAVEGDYQIDITFA